MRNRECPYCDTRFESHADIGHCISCGYPTRPWHGPIAKVYACVRVFVNGIELTEAT